MSRTRELLEKKKNGGSAATAALPTTSRTQQLLAKKGITSVADRTVPANQDSVNALAEMQALGSTVYGGKTYIKGGGSRETTTEDYAKLASGYNSWTENVNAFSARIGNDYNDRQGRYQSGEDLNAYRSSLDGDFSSLTDQANAYRSLFQRNRAQYDAIYGTDAVSTILGAIDSGSSMLSGIDADLKREREYWGKFEDEAAYDLNQKYLRWQDIPNAEDYAEKSQYKTTANGIEPQKNFMRNYYVQTGFDDTLYDYINQNETAQSRQMVNDTQYNTTHSYWKDLPEDVIGTFNYIYATEGPEAAYEYMEIAAEREYTGIEALTLGALNGTGISSVSAALGAGISKLTGNEDAAARNADWYTDLLVAGRTAQEQHPYAYGSGSVGGTLALMAAFSKGIGLIKGFSSLPTIAQASISSAASFGGTTAVQGIGSAATGNQSWGDYALDVGTSTLAGGAGGAASSGIGIAGTKFLQSKGLAGNMLARTVVSGLTGTGFTAGNQLVGQTSQYLRDPENYELDEGKLVEEALVGFAFSALLYLTRNGTTNPGAAAAADDARPQSEFFGMFDDVDDMQAEYRRLAKMYHPDKFAAQGDDAVAAANSTMARINAEYEAQRVWLSTHQGSKAYQKAQQARANGDEATYQQATSEFRQSVAALQTISAEGGLASAEAGEALQILEAVSSGIAGGMAGEAVTGSTTVPLEGAGADVAGQLVAAGATQAEAETLAPILSAVLNGEEISGNQAGTIAKNEVAVSILENATGETINTDAPLGEVKTAIRSLASRTVEPQAAQPPVDTPVQAKPTEAAQMPFGAQSTPTAPKDQSLTVEEKRERFAKALGLVDIGANGIDTMMSPSFGSITHVGGFTAFYNAGRSGKAIEEVKSIYADQLTPDQQKMAYNSGRMDAIAETSGAQTVAKTKEPDYTISKTANKEGLNNGTGEIYLRESGQRADGTNSGGGLSELEEGTGRNPGRQAQGEPADHEAVSLSYGGEVSSAEIGIAGGFDSDAVYLVTGGSTASTRAAQAEADKHGLKLVLFGGGDIHTAEAPDGAIGYVDETTMYVRVDDPDFTADQIAKHEGGHDMIRKGEVNIAVVRRRIETIAGGKEMLERAASLYTWAYEGSSLTPEQIWAECICDSLGDMNIFAGVLDNLGDFVPKLHATLKQAVAESTRTPRGPPADAEGKASRRKRSDLSGREAEKSGKLAADRQVAARGTEKAGPAGIDRRGSGSGSPRGRANQVRYRDLTLYEQERVSELLVTPVDNCPAWAPVIRRIPINTAAESLFNVIADGAPVVKILAAEVPGFAEAVTKVHEFINRQAPRSRSTSVSRDTSPSGEYDADGGQLTVAQVEFFQNSKLRDADGRLLVLYHGSRTDAFSVFDLYEGVWLTPDRRYAEVYADNWHSWRDDAGIGLEDRVLNGLEPEVYADPDLRIYKMYANGEKPVNLGELDDPLTEGKIRELAGKLGVKTAELRKLAEPYMDEYTYSLTRSHEFIGLARFKKFDSFIATESGRETYCIFASPDQVALTTNKTPSSNPDVRYSRRLNLGDKGRALTETETAALLAYKSSESYKLNAKLRDGVELNAEERGMAEALDRALEKLPKVEGVVYRTLNFDDVFDPQEEYKAFMAQHTAGGFVTYEAYTSTSTKADGYPLVDGAKYGVVMEITSRSARDLAGFGNNFESEALFPRDTDFVILSVSTGESDYTHIVMEEAEVNAERDEPDHDTQKRSTAVRGVQESYPVHGDMQSVPDGHPEGDQNREGDLQGARAKVTDVPETYQALYNEEFSKKYASKAARKFGTTSRFDLAGYLTVNGSLLDFSDRQGYRVQDHREISDVLDFLPEEHGYSDGLIEFMNMGNIRMQSYGIDISQPPNTKQVPVLRRFFAHLDGEVTVDFSRENGDSAGSIDYAEGTRPDKILRDIDYFFKNGEVPAQSDVARFHAMYSRKFVSLDDLREENRLLKDRLDELMHYEQQAAAKAVQAEYWKGQTKRTTQPTLRQADVDKLAKRLIHDYDGTVAVEDIASELKALGEFIMRGGEELTWTQVKDRAVSIARDIAQSAQALVDDGEAEIYREIRSRLHGQRIAFNDQGDIADYGDFRKRNMGKFILAKDGLPIDVLWGELNTLYGEAYFPSDIIHPADQLVHLAQLLDDLRPVYENPHSWYMAEAVEYLANDIVDSLIDESVRQTPPTFADRQAAKLSEQKAKDAQRLSALREQKNAKIKEIRRRGVEKTREAVQRVREDRDRKISELKRHYQQKEARGRDNRKAAELRRKIQKHAKELSRELLRPTDKHHIPEALRTPVARLLEAINLESNYELEYGKDANYRRVKPGESLYAETTKRTQAFAALKEAYAKIGGDLVVDPSLLGIDGEAGWLDEVIAMAGKPIADMNSKELEAVWQTIKAVESSIRTANKAFAVGKFQTISEAAGALLTENKGKTGPNENPKISKAQNLLRLDMLTPEAYFHRLGKVGDALFRSMRNAQDQHIRIMKQVSDFTHELLKGADIRKLERTLHTVELGEEKVTLSTAQLMELHALIRRGEKAINHILVGGILPEARAGKENGKRRNLARSSTPVRGITWEQLVNATALLTPEEIVIADALQDYLSGPMSEHGDKASMAVYNYKKFTEEHYWPIRSNSQDIRKQDAAARSNVVTSPANYGMTKATKPKSDTSLLLGSLFDTFSTHTSQMATYSAWLGVTEDLNRIRNFMFRNEQGARTGGVQEILDRVHGRGGSEYLQKLLSDISIGVKGRHAETNYGGALIGNFKAAAVGANLRVIAQQPTAILRALELIDPKYLLAGNLRPFSGWKKARKYAPIAQWKDWGYFDIHTGRQMKDVLFETDSPLDKARNFTMAGAGLADSYAWGVLWNACEMEVREQLGRTNGPSWNELAAKDPIKVVPLADAQGLSYAQLKAQVLDKAQKSGWFNAPHHNRDTGMGVFVSKDTFTHAFSNLTSDFGEDTILAMEHLPELIEEAVLTHVEGPKDPRKAETQVYTLFAAVRGKNGVEPVKLKVKEYNSDTIGTMPENVRAWFAQNKKQPAYHRLYDAKVLEVVSIERETDASASVGGHEGPRAKGTPVSEISVADLLDLVNGDARKYIPAEPGTAEYYRAVAERFTEIIDHTQVVDGILQRSQIMRSDNELTKMATSFMAEPTKQYNALMSAVYDYRNAQGKDAKKTAGGRLARAMMVLFVAAMVNAAAQSLVDALRDDEKERGYWERFFEAYTGIGEDGFTAKSLLDGNAPSALNPLSMIPFAKDVFSAISGYEVTRMDFELVSDLTEAGKNLVKALNGSGKMTLQAAAANFAMVAAKAKGIAVSNFKRDALAIANEIMAATGNYELRYRLLKTSRNFNYSSNVTEVMGLLYEAMCNDEEAYQLIKRDLIADDVLKTDSTSTAQRIKENMKQKYTKAAKAGEAPDLSQKILDELGITTSYAPDTDEEKFSEADLSAGQYERFNSQRASAYRTVVNEIAKYPGWREIDGEIKDKVTNAATTYAKETALAANSSGRYEVETKWIYWATGGDSYRVSEAEAIFFKVLYDSIPGDTKDGKTVSGSKKKNVLAAAEEYMPHLSDTALEYLAAFYWTPSDADLKRRKESDWR